MSALSTVGVIVCYVGKNSAAKLNDNRAYETLYRRLVSRGGYILLPDTLYLTPGDRLLLEAGLRQLDEITLLLSTEFDQEDE